MSLKDLLSNAVKIAVDTTFNVIINDELKEMSYLELGTFLVSNSNEIERIEVVFK